MFRESGWEGHRYERSGRYWFCRSICPFGHDEGALISKKKGLGGARVTRWDTGYGKDQGVKFSRNVQTLRSVVNHVANFTPCSVCQFAIPSHFIYHLFVGKVSEGSNLQEEVDALTMPPSTIQHRPTSPLPQPCHRRFPFRCRQEPIPPRVEGSGRRRRGRHLLPRWFIEVQSGECRSSHTRREICGTYRVLQGTHQVRRLS